MAVDPAMVGFNVVDNLQNTLLSYVMQNRKMQQQDRQFYAELGQRKEEFEETFDEGVRRYDTTFKEGARRYDTTFDEDQKRYDTGRSDILDLRKARRLMAEQGISRNKQKKLIEDFDRDKTSYIENMKNISLGTGGLFSGDYWKSKFAPSPEQYYGAQFDQRVGARPTVSPFQLPNTNQLPDIGLQQMLAGDPSKQSLLNMLMLQGG